MTVVRFAIVSWVAVLLAAGTVLGVWAGPADDPTVPKSAPPAAEPPLPAGAVRIGTGQFRHTGWHSRVFFTSRPVSRGSLGTMPEGKVLLAQPLERVTPDP